MALQVRSAFEVDLGLLADLLSRGYEGYFVPIAMSPNDLAASVRYNTLDLALSQVALLDDKAVGVVFVAVRGWQCRIAALGVVTEARRHGIGRRLMEEAIAGGRAAGLQGMILEVIEQNEPALALYQDLGFETLRRLVGYDLSARSSEPSEQARRDAAALVPVDPREVGRRVALEAAPDLPWQLAAETFATRGCRLSGFQLHGKACALVNDSGDGAVVLEALVVAQQDRRAGWGSRLFQALGFRFQDKAWRIPERVPDDLAAPFWTGLGFRQAPLSQLEMRLAL